MLYPHEKRKDSECTAFDPAGIGCFLYVADVVIAVIYFGIARKRNKKPALSSVSAKAVG
jgi:hypothetical protein